MSRSRTQLRAPHVLYNASLLEEAKANSLMKVPPEFTVMYVPSALTGPVSSRYILAPVSQLSYSTEPQLKKNGLHELVPVCVGAQVFDDDAVSVELADDGGGESLGVCV